MLQPTFTWPSKSPGEVKDYGFDWTPHLEPDEYIMTSTWTSTEGITVYEYGLSEEEPKVTVIKLSGGQDRQSYRFMNRIGTSGGRAYERVAVLHVRAR